MTYRFYRHDISWEEYKSVLPLHPPAAVYPPEATYNAAPNSLQPVLRLSRRGGHVNMAPCIWGLIPSWWTKPLAEKTFQTFNAHAETVAEKPVFRGAFRHKRCLVPVSGFYQWTGPQGARTPFAVTLRGQRWFCLAGLWDTAFIDGSEIQSFTIITTTPNDLMSGLHTRMPVIINPADYLRWLDPGAGAVSRFWEPFPSDDMKAWPINDAVGNVHNDTPSLLDEV